MDKQKCTCGCLESSHMGKPTGCNAHGFHEFTPEATAQQVGGDHYEKMAIQPWEVIQRGALDFWEGNVIKYVMRYRDKNGLEDLKKARHYLDYLIEREQKNAELDF